MVFCKGLWAFQARCNPHANSDTNAGCLHGRKYPHPIAAFCLRHALGPHRQTKMSYLSFARVGDYQHAHLMGNGSSHSQRIQAQAHPQHFSWRCGPPQKHAASVEQAEEIALIALEGAAIANAAHIFIVAPFTLNNKVTSAASTTIRD
eukprot:CAMPEP_0172682380 /NCGR_PEP_ID=MMETSP1074-20121228/18131_1 /TAXON_ID=2916 /ORGANISM="Ceratium fusus, Strain PA161109" /LENGTH=147 /DNA_ID=CAMNT_0013501055 /DNA_START=520 /DNA_END=964 /DNA_ORIENTATION=+